MAHFQQTVNRYAGIRPEDLPEQLAAAVAAQPACPVARYLLGCHCLEHGRPATAVRHLMVAHHADVQLASAALLVFAGLNWGLRANEALLPVLLATWDEFRRPEFDCSRHERMLFDAFAEPDPGAMQVAPLARRLWRLPLRTLRAEIRAAVLSRDAGLYPLLTSPA